VHRLLRHEEALQGFSARSASEACRSVFGSGSQLIELRDVKANYAEILRAVGALTQEQLLALRPEQEKLRQEVEAIEDLIVLCFEKMDEEGTGSIPREQFVDFVCAEGDENQCVLMTSPEDAENLFNQMSKGKQVITYEQFKDEITYGCLQVLRGNIDLRRSLHKKYRDCWF